MRQAKPLFTGEFVAFSEFDREALEALLRGMARPCKRVVEVGSWLGNGSTRTLLEELRGKGVLYCVDHWRGNPNVPRHQELAARYDVLATFRANVSSFGGAEVVKPLVMSGEEAAGILRDEAFDMVFLDGDHSYDATRKDIEQWLPKVAPGGVLCGHDCEGRPADFDRAWLWANRQEDSLADGRRFSRIHPGPILAVAERFGQAARLFADAPVRLADGRAGHSSIWAWTKPPPGLAARMASWVMRGSK